MVIDTNQLKSWVEEEYDFKSSNEIRERKRVDIFTRDGKYYCGYCLSEITDGDIKNANIQGFQVCEKCGCRRDLSRINDPEMVEGSRYSRLYFPKKQSYITSYNVFENENGSLSIKFYYKTITLDKKNKFRISNYTQPFNFNFDKGQIYHLPTINTQTRKRLRKKNNVLRITTYTPSFFQDYYNLLEKKDQYVIFDIFYNHALKYLKYKDEKEVLAKEYKDFKDSVLERRCGISTTVLFALTRFHRISENYTDFFNNCRIGEFMSDISYRKQKEIRKIWLSHNHMDVAEKIVKIKLSNEFKDIYRGDMHLFFGSYKIGKLKIDSQKKIFKEIEELENLPKYACFESGFSYRDEYLFKNVYDFVTIFKNENAGVNRFIKLIKATANDSRCDRFTIKRLLGNYIFTDSISMLKSLIEQDFSIKKYIKNKSIIEMHDDLMKVFQKLDQENLTIKHSDEEKRLEVKITDKEDDLYVSLCNETCELHNLGLLMNNCVGSYRRDALAKNCNIMYAHRNNKLVACIELRNNDLHQVKGYSNQKLADNDQSLIKAWALNKGLSWSKSFDLADEIKPASVEITDCYNPLSDLSKNKEIVGGRTGYHRHYTRNLETANLIDLW